MAFLVIASHHLGIAFEVQTDGDSGHWSDAFALCRSVLGYGAGYTCHDGHVLAGEQEAQCA